MIDHKEKDTTDKNEDHAKSLIVVVMYLYRR